MALISRHYEIMEAIRSSIIADADIVAAIPADRWRIRKKPWSRNQKWKPGALICSLRREKPAHENETALTICPVLVSLIWPSDGSLVSDQDVESAVMERIEQIFEWKARTKSPAPMRALDALHTGANKYIFQRCTVQPGEPFVEAAFRDGFDALACVITVDIQSTITNESTLGA